LLTAAFAVSVGSALTPLGNPQNLLISISSGLSAPLLTFLRYLLQPIGAGLLLGGLYLRRVFRKDLAPANAALERARGPPVSLLPHGGWERRLVHYPVLAIFPATIVVLLGLDLSTEFLGIPNVAVWIPAVAGAVLLFAISPGRGAIARSIDLRILTLFAGLFVVVAGALSAGVIALIESGLPIVGPSQATYGILGIAGTSVLGSQLFSNVPWVGLQIPVLAHLGYNGSTPLGWIALAAGSTLAGNVTLLGAASNLIMVERAEERGVHIGLGEFVRHALPLAALTLAFVVVALLVGL
ncbi:MAG: SLC13 family permease, partial [Thermoplasmata archaeon]